MSLVTFSGRYVRNGGTATTCPGAVNGDVAIRADGTKAGANTLYNLEAGVWTAQV